jgi:hypothetical protein
MKLFWAIRGQPRLHIGKLRFVWVCGTPLFGWIHTPDIGSVGRHRGVMVWRLAVFWLDDPSQISQRGEIPT